MKRNTIVFAGLAVALSLLSGTVSAAGTGTRSMRGQLVHDIVLKWGVHVQTAQGADVHAWANRMGPLFANASLDTLAKAARAGSFDEMNNAFLVDRKGDGVDSRLTMANSVPVLATATKALGDAATDLVYVPVTPCRIIDTRVAGGAIAANTTRDFDVTQEASPITSYAGQGGDASNCGIGNQGAFAAAVINFTVVTPGAAGYITAFPSGTTQPLAATVNYTAGDIRGNLAIVKLSQTAAANELSVYTFAQTHLVADVVGFFTNPQATSFNCTNTTVQTFTITANSVNFFNNPNCPVGYTAVTPYCWTASSGVYSQGSGYNANAVGNATFCSWQNTTASNQSVFGGNVCCRVPGR